MTFRALRRLAVASAFGLACAFNAWAQPAPPAAAASAAPASNPLLTLPVWAQEKLIAARDPKVFEQYYKTGRKVADFCANCHGPHGQSVIAEVPNLAGQNTIYVIAQLVKFTEGKRKQFFMEGLMKALNQEEKVAVAIYYTSQEAKALPVADPALADRGKALYVKACQKCHGELGHGNEKNARLAGQHPEYLASNIKRYRDGSLARADEKMVKASKALTDEDVKVLVAYIGSLG